MSARNPTDFTLRDLYRTLDQRKRPEDVANMMLALSSPPDEIAKLLRQVSEAGHGYSYMSGDFHRCSADLSRQVGLAAHLFATSFAADLQDLQAVRQYLHEVEGRIGKQFGKNDYKHDRLNKDQREALGIDLSRRQYNKRFRLAAKLEDKARRTERERLKRTLTLASKSRLASQLTWEQFSSDFPTACFIAYYVARCNLRSIFTLNSQARPFDEVCEAMMRLLRTSATTNWLAIAHAMPDEQVLQRLDEHDKGALMGRCYEMLLAVARFLREVWDHGGISVQTMIVRRGNDSSTWNLMAGAWNKLRDGWFALCHALGADQIIERQCFGKVMRLMAADVAMWHKAAGGKTHTDTDVWAALPLPWKVLAGEDVCTREQVERMCQRFGIDPLKSGWLARRGARHVEAFAPTPELVHGVIVSSPQMARAMRKAGVFSGQSLRLGTADIAIEELIAATENARETHWTEQTLKKESEAE